MGEDQMLKTEQNVKIKVVGVGGAGGKRDPEDGG